MTQTTFIIIQSSEADRITTGRQNLCQNRSIFPRGSSDGTICPYVCLFKSDECFPSERPVLLDSCPSRGAPPSGFSHRTLVTGCQVSVRSLSGNRGAKLLHGLHNQLQVVQEGADGHSQDPSFVCAPPPETETCKNLQGRQEEGSRRAESHTDKVLPLTLRCLLIPPLLGSLSGDRELRAMVASRGDGNGTSRELQGGQGETEQKPNTSEVYLSSTEELQGSVTSQNQLTVKQSRFH